MTSAEDAVALVSELRRIAPRYKEGTARGFAFNMDGLCLQELNELINKAADSIEALTKQQHGDDVVERVAVSLEKAMLAHGTNDKTYIAPEDAEALARAALDALQLKGE